MKKKLLALTIAALTAFAATGCAQAVQASTTTAATATEASTDSITVTADSSVAVVPDMVQITFGVSTQAETAEKAQSENTEKVNKVLKQLEKFGIDKKSIQTTGYNMYANYDYENNNAITGYNVDTTLKISDQKIEDAGKLITDCVNAGINNIQNIEYTCSTYDESYQKALTDSVAVAQEKAEALASASGRKLGTISNITEGYQDTSARYRDSGATLGMAKASADSVSMEPGQMDIQANVTVTFKLN